MARIQTPINFHIIDLTGKTPVVAHSWPLAKRQSLRDFDLWLLVTAPKVAIGVQFYFPRNIKIGEDVEVASTRSKKVALGKTITEGVINLRRINRGYINVRTKQGNLTPVLVQLFYHPDNSSESRDDNAIDMVYVVGKASDLEILNKNKNKVAVLTSYVHEPSSTLSAVILTTDINALTEQIKKARGNIKEKNSGVLPFHILLV